MCFAAGCASDDVGALPLPVPWHAVASVTRKPGESLGDIDPETLGKTRGVQCAVDPAPQGRLSCVAFPWLVPPPNVTSMLAPVVGAEALKTTLGKTKLPPKAKSAHPMTASAEIGYACVVCRVVSCSLSGGRQLVVALPPVSCRSWDWEIARDDPMINGETRSRNKCPETKVGCHCRHLTNSCCGLAWVLTGRGLFLCVFASRLAMRVRAVLRIVHLNDGHNAVSSHGCAEVGVVGAAWSSSVHS